MDHNMQAFVRASIGLSIQETLKHCDLAYLHELTAIRHTLHKIMGTQTQLAENLAALKGTVTVVGTGVSTIIQQLADLQGKVGNTTPEVDAAFADLQSTVNSVAALVPPPAPANG